MGRRSVPFKFDIGLRQAGGHRSEGEWQRPAGSVEADAGLNPGSPGDSTTPDITSRAAPGQLDGGKPHRE